MVTGTSNSAVKSSNELATERTTLADERTQLALTRTLVALDRTLMAWVRTATSLISFGFTIYKFFQQLRQDAPATPHLLGPRGVALVLIGIGVGGLVMATLEYRNQVRAIRAQYQSYGPFHRSIAATLATVIAGLGIIGFILVFLRQ